MNAGFYFTWKTGIDGGVGGCMTDFHAYSIQHNFG